MTSDTAERVARSEVVIIVGARAAAHDVVGWSDYWAVDVAMAAAVAGRLSGTLRHRRDHYRWRTPRGGGLGFSLGRGIRLQCRSSSSSCPAIADRVALQRRQSSADLRRYPKLVGRGQQTRAVEKVRQAFSQSRSAISTTARICSAPMAYGI